MATITISNLDDGHSVEEDARPLIFKVVEQAPRLWNPASVIRSRLGPANRVDPALLPREPGPEPPAIAQVAVRRGAA